MGVCVQETWHAMESLVDQGLTKAIGISNYSSKKVKDLLGYCRIKPALYQGEVWPGRTFPVALWLIVQQGIRRLALDVWQ